MPRVKFNFGSATMPGDDGIQYGQFNFFFTSKYLIESLTLP